MSGYVVDSDGREWATAARAAVDLAVAVGLIRLWAHRYREQVERHVTADGTWYRLDQLRAVEVATNDRLTRTSAKRAA